MDVRDEANPLDPAALRAELGKLVKRGAEPYWILDVAPRLLDLQIVRDQAGHAYDRDEDAKARALVEVLNQTLPLIGRRSDRVMLGIVLGLDSSDLLDLSARERRQLAGERFRGGRHAVTWGTIRQYHEPRALDRLAELVVARERERIQSRAGEID
jgi:hypothetical protein